MFLYTLFIYKKTCIENDDDQKFTNVHNKLGKGQRFEKRAHEKILIIKTLPLFVKLLFRYTEILTSTYTVQKTPTTDRSGRSEHTIEWRRLVVSENRSFSSGYYHNYHVYFTLSNFFFFGWI